MRHLAIVTGASRGIGLAICKEFLKHGVSVIAVARSHETLNKLQDMFAAEYEQSAFIPCTADITKPEDIDSIVQCLEQSRMELCALINNSGIIEPLAKIANMDMEQWRYCLEVNTTAIVALTQKLVPVLQKNKGCVINVSSGAATIAMQGWSAYCASKAALNMITACIAVEEPNIVTLAIGPGTVDTDIQTVIRDAGEEAMHPAEHAKLKELHATGGLLPPEKPAHAIVKLALRAPIEISGMFYSWDSPEIAKYVE